MIHFKVMNNPVYPFIEDLDDVLERLGGSEALLSKLLAKFGSTYRNSGAELVRLLEEAQQEDAYRLVHSIKGVSANLGIGVLYQAAIELETHMKAGEYSAGLPETEKFCAELALVLRSM